MRKTTRKEAGVAIVFALGMISLLFVLALGFSTNAIIKRKTADNNNQQKTARIIAQSGLQRVIAAMQYNCINVSKDFTNVVSHQGNDYEDLVDLFPTEIDGITYYSWPENYNSKDNDSLTWHYLPDIGNVNVPIIARFAYIVIPDNGKIDIAAGVDSGLNAYNNNVDAISEQYPPNEATGIDENGNEIIGRPGRSISELFLATLSCIGNTDSAIKISSNAIDSDPDGTLAYGTRWLDLHTIFSSLDITENSIKTNFFNIFATDNPPIPEAYWIDNGDYLREESEFYHRFNLTRTDWNTLTIDSVKAEPVQFSSSQGGGIPWLANWTDEGGFGRGNSEQCKNQIIANLIDYNDTDCNATTDYPTNNPPTYVGLEKCPYINEVKLIFDGEVEAVIAGTANNNSYETIQSIARNLESNPQDLYLPPTLYAKKEKEEKGGGKKAQYDYTCRVNLSSAAIEIVNMYDSTMNIIAHIYVSGEFQWNPMKETITFTDKYIGSESFTAREKSYGTITIDSPASLYIDTLTDKEGAKREITKFKITNLHIRLTDENDTLLYDYSTIIDADNTTNSQTLSSNGSTGYLYLNAQITDPRQNLIVDDWTNSIVFTDTDEPVIGTIGSKNSGYYTPSSGDDPEPQKPPFSEEREPWELSTAYIRNAPMKSPWELGFIHRGEAWQTLNLKKYYSGFDIGNGGGNDYSDGDANILDQIKMTSETETYGKININTNYQDALKVLFEKIRVGSNIEHIDGPGCLSKNDGSGAYELTSPFSEALAKEVLNYNGTNDSRIDKFYSRSQILRDSNGLTEALCHDNEIQGAELTFDRTTDATQEEIIGKMINLTTTLYPNVFEIIVVAQAINDIGVPSENKTVSVNGIGCKTGRYDSGADEILSTQKIYARVVKDPISNRFHILSQNYIE